MGDELALLAPGEEGLQDAEEVIGLTRSVHEAIDDRGAVTCRDLVEGLLEPNGVSADQSLDVAGRALAVVRPDVGLKVCFERVVEVLGSDRRLSLSEGDRCHLPCLGERHRIVFADADPVPGITGTDQDKEGLRAGRRNANAEVALIRAEIVDLPSQRASGL